ncbi:MFS transporter [Gordonia rhizosphera]|uniref:Putative drug resistance transporter n=1 Tax=Gordonia rhizosphera NBRC 16068 TaxID=1108045 RepID=K6WCY9_9ACTN|nr:MFS transporter [Gordonia rhizosphera]GAB90057.1 putative drug resistance transporter [Gordonia rhizosphera NBRC 16068]
MTLLDTTSGAKIAPAATHPATPASPSAITRRVTLVVVCLATAMLMLDIAVVNTALPTIARELGSGMGGLKWVVDGYTLALATIVLSAGVWSDRLGRKAVFVWGTVVFTIASLLCTMAGTMEVLIGARIVQGLGAALLFASSLAVLADAFDDLAARAKALAIYGATIGASFAIGPVVGGVLTETLDWRAIFAVNVPIGGVMLVATRWVRESRSANPRRGDWAGQILVIVALAGLAYGLIGANDRGWSDSVTVAALAIAAAATAAFIVVERRVAEPMLPLSMFSNSSFAGGQVATFAISASMFALFVYTTIYLQGVLGMSAIEAGLVYVPGTAVMLVVAGATDQLVGRIPTWILLSVALVAVAVGLAAMTIGGVEGSGWAIAPGFALSCIGAGIFNPVMSGLVLAESHADDAGLAAGINDVFRQSGIALGVAALGAIFPAQSVLAGGSAVDFVSSLHVALWVGTGVALAGAAVCALTMRGVVAAQR